LRLSHFATRAQGAAGKEEMAPLVPEINMEANKKTVCRRWTANAAFIGACRKGSTCHGDRLKTNERGRVIKKEFRRQLSRGKKWERQETVQKGRFRWRGGGKATGGGKQRIKTLKSVSLQKPASGQLQSREKFGLLQGAGR